MLKRKRFFNLYRDKQFTEKLYIIDTATGEVFYAFFGTWLPYCGHLSISTSCYQRQIKERCQLIGKNLRSKV